MTSQSAASAAADWGRLAAVLLSRAYRAMLLTLSVVAIAPMLFSYASFVIKSGSMEPVIAVGDVVVARPFAVDEKVAVGRVYVFDDPATDEEHLITHRIVERRDDGSYTSAGDANDVTDVAAVTAGDMEARAIVLVPYVGLPVAWAQTGQWLELALWLLLTIAAFVTATRNLEGEPPKWTLLRLFLDWRRERADIADTDETPADESEVEEPDEASGTPDRVLARHRGVASTTLGVVLALALAGTTMGTSNAMFTAQNKNGSNRWTVGAFVQKYVGAVLADQPYGFWLLDEPAGAAYGADRSGNNRTAQYYGSLNLGTPGGLPGNPGTSLDNSGGRAILGPQAVPAPSAYSIELWFRTTSRSRSYLAGFENDRDAGYSFFSTSADRVVSMEGSGQLTFGAWPWGNQEITTPRAYNDGAWHHLVVTSGANRFTTIYVDGAAVASGTTTAVDSYMGYWRVGQGSLGFFSTPSFDGVIDNVSIFHSVLPSARVNAHWAAR